MIAGLAPVVVFVELLSPLIVLIEAGVINSASPDVEVDDETVAEADDETVPGADDEAVTEIEGGIEPEDDVSELVEEFRMELLALSP